MSAWTKFDDMHSGGGRKLAAEEIWIEASQAEAVELFESIFGRDPYNVTCDCCGGDYLVSETVEPKILSGSIVVTAQDIERFHGGHRLEVMP